MGDRAAVALGRMRVSLSSLSLTSVAAAEVSGTRTECGGDHCLTCTFSPLPALDGYTIVAGEKEVEGWAMRIANLVCRSDCIQQHHTASHLL